MNRATNLLALTGLSIALNAQTPAQTRIDLQPPGAFRQPGLGGAAQNNSATRIAGPTFGFVLDGTSGALRRIYGVTGSSSIAEELRLPARLSRAYVSPQQDYALAITSGSEQISVVSLSQGAVTAVNPITALSPSPLRLVFSPSGNAAAAYYDGTHQVIALTGMPNAPAVAGSWDLTEFGGSISTIAVQDSGLALAGLVRDGASALLLLAPNKPASQLLPMSQPSAVAFLWGREDAVIADAAAGTISLVHNVRGALSTQILAQAEDGLATADLLTVDRSSTKVLAAQHGTGSSLLINLTTSAKLPITCDCVITSLEPLNGNAVYRITDIVRDQILTLDVSSDVPALGAVLSPPRGRGLEDRPDAGGLQ